MAKLFAFDLIFYFLFGLFVIVSTASLAAPRFSESGLALSQFAIVIFPQKES
jgi:hypothetical protein